MPFARMFFATSVLVSFALGGEPSQPSPARVAENTDAERPTNGEALPRLASALTRLEAIHHDLVFDEWHGADLDLGELRHRLGLEDWEAPFRREALLAGVEAIYAKTAGSAEMRSVLSQLEVRNALAADLDRMTAPLDENDPIRVRAEKIVDRLVQSLLVQSNDERHAIRLTGMGPLQRLRVEDRRTGKPIFDDGVRFETDRVDGQLVVVLPNAVENLPPRIRVKVRSMLTREDVRPHLNIGN